MSEKMAFSSDSTKNTRILRTTRDWHTWYGSIATQAMQLEVWEYLDPQSTKELTEPTQPSIPDGDSVLTNVQELIFKLNFEKYSRNHAAWLRAKSNLASIRTTICNSVDPLHISDLAARIVSPREILQKLKQRLCPTDTTRANELLRRYENLKKSPKGSQDLEKWIYEWIEIVRDGMELHEIEKKSAIRAFYRANAKINESLTDSISMWADTQDECSFEDIANKFLQKYREKGIGSKTTSSHFAFATASEPTLQGRPATSTTATDKKRPCLCGEEHAWKVCMYIVPEMRPQGWKGNNDTQNKVDDKISKNPNVKRVVERIRRHTTKNDKPKKSKQHSANMVANDANSVAITDVNSDDNDGENWVNFLTIAMSTDAKSNYALRNSFIVDPASHLHVCNMRDRFVSIESCDGKTLLTGDNGTVIEGFGYAYLWVTRACGKREKVKIYAAYIPGFHTNLISTRILVREQNIGLNELAMELQRANGDCVAKLECHQDFLVAEYNPINDLSDNNAALATGMNFPSPATASKSSSKSAALKPASATEDIWSARLGHPSKQAISHLPDVNPNTTISNIAPKVLNEVKELAVANQQISRMKTYRANAPFETIYWDIVYFKPIGFNGDKYMSHMYCENSHLHFVDTLQSKSACVKSLTVMIKRVERRFPDFKIVILRTDVEQSLGKDFRAFIDDLGIFHDMSAPYVKQQNGGAERSGQMILNRARALTIEAGFPKNMWPEAVKAAADLLNLTPIKSLNWKSPLMLLYERLKLAPPTLAHIRIYGCRAYVRDPKIAKGDKMQPRAFIGYLVGYDSTNIFRIWVPHRGKVVRVRDVHFDETKRYEPTDKVDKHKIDEVIEIASIPAADDIQLGYVEHTLSQLLWDKTSKSISENTGFQALPFTTESQVLPTPDPTPEPESITLPAKGEAVTASIHAASKAFPSSDVSADNIIVGKRQRKSTERATPPRRAAYNAILENDLDIAENAIENTYAAFNMASASPLTRHHQTDLPLPPKNWHDMLRHPLAEEFQAAAKLEWDTVTKKDTYKRVKRPGSNVKVLPLRWVFTYKFGSDGYLVKCKARICARGDLQTLSEFLDARATTLAARVFRALMAIAAKFDLDMEHLDAVNAFLNSSLKENVYCEFPEGFEHEDPDACILLLRALYGLRPSGRLWQDNFSDTLSNIGLKQVPEEPCLYISTTSSVIVFFYVDDIVLLARREHRKELENVKMKLMQRYEMRDLGELQWFLNINVVRDRNQRKISLSQEAYIDKIVKRYHLEHAPKANTPLSLPRREFVKNDGVKATPQETHAYQQRIGSCIYPAVTTRPDIAHAASLLAQFLQNPSPRHRAEADRLICYLRDSKHLAIEYSGTATTQIFEAACDAAYADDKETRRSSEGWIFKFFGGPVDWKAARQTTVTTSTTEAELLALSHAGSALIWWKRFFNQLDFQLGPDSH